MNQVKVPEPIESDPSGVSIALETAATLWENGGTDQALEWLRRASASADEAGDDMRSLSLARAAADLADEIQNAAAAEAPAAEAPAGEAKSDSKAAEPNK